MGIKTSLKLSGITIEKDDGDFYSVHFHYFYKTHYSTRINFYEYVDATNFIENIFVTARAHGWYKVYYEWSNLCKCAIGRRNAQ